MREMSTQVKVPSVGESITRGTIVSWLKKSGEAVKQAEILFELETDFRHQDFPSPAAGVLEILVEEGREVQIDQTVATISEGAEPSQQPVEKAQEKPAQAGPRPPEEQAASAKEKAERQTGQKKPEPKKQEAAAEPVPQAPPREYAPAPAAAAGQKRPSERIPMTAIRKRTAQRLVRARREAAHLTTFNEIDMQKVVDIRDRYKERFEKEHGIRIGFMSFFVKAACQALKEFAAVNTQVDGDDIIYHHFYDIGVAISIEGGLVVPVIRDADRRHFAEIEATIADLARRANEKKLSPEELTGGTFTITNGGVFGSLMSTPIPAYPQTAILGMHAIKKRPVVVDDAIVVRPMMYVALSYDHRVIDGREAIGFLSRIKEYIEEPDKLLLEL